MKKKAKRTLRAYTFLLGKERGIKDSKLNIVRRDIIGLKEDEETGEKKKVKVGERHQAYYEGLERIYRNVKKLYKQGAIKLETIQKELKNAGFTGF